MLTFGGKMLKVGDGALKVTPPSDEVKIGNQIWKRTNLAIDDGQGGIYTKTVNYGQGDVVEYYYTWDAAVRVAASIQGWHLPTDAEWDTLANTVGAGNAGTKLKSTYGWSESNGTDDYGFAVFPAGYKYTTSILSIGYRVFFWTANEASSSNANYRRFYRSSGIMSGNNGKAYGYSVRLIKDV